MGRVKLRKSFAEFVKTELGSGFFLIVCGLPGTGKTVLAEQVAELKDYPLISSDRIRRELLRNEELFDNKVAADMRKRLLVYEEVFRQAEASLKGQGGAILDATFILQSLRRRAAEMAAKHNLTLVILQTDCPESVAIKRILSRTPDNFRSNALTEEAYLNNKKSFEAVDLDDLKGLYPNLNILYLLVDTRDDLSRDWSVINVAKR